MAMNQQHRDRIFRRHRRIAAVRSWASAVMWVAALAALLAGILPDTSFMGITGAVLFLVALRWPSLWIVKRLESHGSVQLWSLVFNALEISGYTVIIHFSGGIEAANLTLIYAAMVAYVGILGRKRLPFAIAALSSLAFSIMVVAEQVGWLPHRPLKESASIPWPTQVLITLVSVSLLFVVAALSARAAGLLWRSKERLRESESQFRYLVENVPGLVYLARPGPPPRTLFLGGQVEELTGHTTDQLLEEARPLLERCHPDDRAEVQGRIARAVEAQESYVVAYRLRHADGGWRWVEERGRPVVGEDDQLRFIEAMVLEIADRKLLEEETTLRKVIQENAREWQTTFDTVESPILILDGAGRIERLNRAARDLAGISFEECRGRYLGGVKSQDPWLTSEELVAKALETRSGAATYQLVAAGSKSWDLSVIFSPRFVEERVILIMQDVTRIVELEESLRRGETLAAMGTLVGGVAHEVRNPLFGISATLDAVKALFATNEDLRPYLDVLRSQVDRITTLMNGLLAYGRSSVSDRSVEPLEEILAVAVADCGPLARDLGVEIEKSFALEGREVSMHRDGLLTLFTNLVTNAVQHSQPEGRVVVDARVEGIDQEWLSCTVRDSGKGFSEEALARGFEPFFTRRPGGLGLGLAIVERVVGEHGGKVRLGNLPDGGAEVRVTLPCS